MSREFGDYISGYMHDKVSYAADDCAIGHEPLTRAFGRLLRVLADVAYDIASIEAGDSSPPCDTDSWRQHYPRVIDAINKLNAICADAREQAESKP